MGAELNPQQEEAVQYGGGPLLVIAGAGSGKTRTLTSRLIQLLTSGVPPEEIIAITFTNKAAEEMKSRISKYRNVEMSKYAGPFVGTFHSLGARILRAEAKEADRTPAFSIFDGDDSLRLIKTVMEEMGIVKEREGPFKFVAAIGRVKNELLNPEEELDQKELDFFERYEAGLKKSNAFDFDDLIQKPVLLWEKHAEILARYRERFRHILVDEFQDVNTAQYRFVKLLAEVHRNLCVVGDDSQSIYGFRGSDFRNFLNFEDDWPEARVVKLEQNYRSTQTIIAAASGVIAGNRFQKSKELWTENEEGTPIAVVKAGGENEEAEWVVEQIKNQRSKIKSKEGENIGILYRTNAQSRALEQALIAAQIPYRLFGGVKFYERLEVKDAVAGLRLAQNPEDRVSRERIEKNFNKKTGDRLLAELPGAAKKLSLLELIGWFLKTADYRNHLTRKFKNAEERWENIQELILFAGECQNLSEFLERVSLLQSSDRPTRNIELSKYRNIPNPLPSVNLMTIHLAKGLEFDRVFVAGVNEGTLPHHRSYRVADELEEERRLMYVAMTRAKKELFLSFSHIPSRFLYEIPGHLTEFIDLSGKGGGELPDEEEAYID